MTDSPRGAAVPDQISYLDAAAATAAGAAYKRRLADLLDLRAGQVAADLGCGPGTDLARLADAVGDSGTVLGVDRDAGMVTEARRRLAGRPAVRVELGDLHELPLDSGSVDRARADRVLQHVADPARAVAEAGRVLRPGGRLGLAEPDWDTLAVADEDVATSRAFAAHLAGRVRNPTIGRELVRLCAAAGLTVRAVEPVPVLFRDFGTADRILGIRRNARQAAGQGRLPAGRTEDWLRRLVAGPLVAGFTCYLVTADRQ